MFKLLHRDEFRNAVFNRDNHKCVICGSPAQDAHHIIERRLFSDGGYYIENGASVCGECHIKCEATLISPEDLRLAISIKKFPLPEHFYDDLQYDKWGNIVMPNGQRMKGDLFNDESVQKILKHGQVLDLFTTRVKYPRTYHVPWSPGIHDDDRARKDMSDFEGKEVVIHLKMDGENFTMYNDYCHARSVDSKNHSSRNWAKNFHAQIMADIPEGWRVCSENMYALHSISYTNLESFVLGFSIWNEKNICLEYQHDTREWFKLLGITESPVLYEGPYSRKELERIEKSLVWERDEGYVIRCNESFHYSEFKNKVAKYVRRGHIQTTQHWMHGKEVVPNKLK